MTLPDPESSRAVLIGTWKYEGGRFEELPGVRNNVRTLRNLLCDPDLWGLPDDHCRIVEQPSNPLELVGPVQSVADEATDTLVVYYSGIPTAASRSLLFFRRSPHTAHSCGNW